MRKFLGTMIWPVLCGILLAIVLLNYLPQFIGGKDAMHSPDSEQGVVRRDSYANAVARAAPAVVTVSSLRALYEDNPKSPLNNDPIYQNNSGQHIPSDDQANSNDEQLINLGSGVIVSHSGYILTNNHVVRSADQIVVTLADGRSADAKLIGSDAETDLAVLKISMNNLPTVRFADNYRVRTGDIALAIGNPFNIGQSVTMGIVSAVGRARIGVSSYEDFIQTDASINPGNSGGALIDADGRLIGINTAIFSRSVGSQGIGFAIPIHVARSVLDMIIKYGRVERGYLGIDASQPSEPPPMMTDKKGPLPLVVSHVTPNGPGDNAGVQVGDLILAINGIPLLNPYRALNEIANLRPGTIITMTLQRGRIRLLVHVTVGIRPPHLATIYKPKETPRAQTPSEAPYKKRKQAHGSSITNQSYRESNDEGNPSFEWNSNYMNLTTPSDEEWNTPYEPHIDYNDSQGITSPSQ